MMKNDNRDNLPNTNPVIMEEYNKKVKTCYQRRDFDEERVWELKVIELQGENNPQSAFNYFRIAMSYQQLQNAYRQLQ